MEPLGEILNSEKYVAGRQRPRFRDLDCLILEDVLKLVQSFAPTVRGQLFDFGCGGSPYRPLFSHIQKYIRADVTPAPGLDRLLDPSGLTAEPDNCYDAILSTQVLEHLADPRVYLRECRRILRPSGRMLLTAPFLFEEHGCPSDYQRWTAVGLEQAVREAGFDIESTHKITTGPRAGIQLYNYLLVEMSMPGHRRWNALFQIVGQIHLRTGVPFLNAMARLFSSAGVVPGSHPTPFYICVGITARKPGNP